MIVDAKRDKDVLGQALVFLPSKTNKGYRQERDTSVFHREQP